MYAIRSYYATAVQPRRHDEHDEQKASGGLGHRAPSRAAAALPAPRGRPSRITSYNVCYTKLLRFLAGNREDAEGGVLGRARTGTQIEEVGDRAAVEATADADGRRPVEGRRDARGRREMHRLAVVDPRDVEEQQFP